MDGGRGLAPCAFGGGGNGMPHPEVEVDEVLLEDVGKEDGRTPFTLESRSRLSLARRF